MGAWTVGLTPARRTIAVGLLVTGVGCSGGGTTSPAAPVRPEVAASGKVSFQIGVTAPTAAARHAQYVSRGTKSIVIVVHNAGAADARFVFDCPNGCSGSLDAAIGQDTFAITAFDTAGGSGNALATGVASVDVRSGVANRISAVLGGIVTTLALSLAPAAFVSGTPGRGTLTVVPLDASGNTIIGSDAFAAPVTVSLANGAFTLGSTIVTDPSNASIPISYSGATFAAPAIVTATAAGTNVGSLALMLAQPQASAPPGALTGRTISAAGFVDSIGVVTHLNYNGSPYTSNEPAVVSAIIGLHVHHVREGMLYPFTTQPATLQAAVHTLSAAGVRSLAGMTAQDLTAPDFATRWSTWFDSVGGTSWVEATETPNECDLNSCLRAIAAYQRTLYTTVKGYGPSVGVSVLGPSFANSSSYAAVGSLAAYLDAGNVHLYTLSQPAETTGTCRVSDQCAGGAGVGSPIGNTYALGDLLGRDAVTSGSKPIINGETGICTTVDASGNTRYNNVPVSVQAAYWPRYLLHAFGDLGVPRTYVYEMADDGTADADFNHCGLLDINAAPRPAYRILKTILDAVNDPGVASIPAPLGYSITAPKNVDGNDVSSMALAARNGSYTVFIWNPVSLFYQQSGNGGDLSHVLSVAPIQGSLTIAHPFTSAQLTTFDLTTGNATTIAVDPSGSIPLSITPAVTMVTLHP